MIDTVHCCLCGSDQASMFYTEPQRDYLRCTHCRLVFVPPRYHLSRAQEKAEYDLHHNEVDDPGYRKFLSRLADPLMERVHVPAQGLDFGCGSGPALGAMLQERGYTISLYDSFYHPDASVWRRQYDFICATEVVEHLHRPGFELDRLWTALRPGGYLAVMTKLVRDREAFSCWHYKRDPTHVSFFSMQTWRWWAGRHGTEAELLGADVIFMGKPAG